MTDHNGHRIPATARTRLNRLAATVAVTIALAAGALALDARPAQAMIERPRPCEWIRVNGEWVCVPPPIIVIWGRHDKLISFVYAKEFADRITGARVEIIEEAGHVPQWEALEKVGPLVTEFLKAG